MVKWRLMLTTLPLVLVVLGLKLGVELGLGYAGVVEFSEIGPVLAGGVFLIGLMLGGTMADFKESEKLPGEVACILETLEELCVQATVARPGIDATQLRKAILDLTEAIFLRLRRQSEPPALFAALTTMNGAIQQLERDGGGAYASRALSELHNLRRSLTRIQVISRTQFLASGYALLHTLVGIILVLLVFAKFKSVLAMCILVPFVTLIYTYMVRLIRDVDDPFDYAADGGGQGSEVDLFPLEEYRKRLKARVGA